MDKVLKRLMVVLLCLAQLINTVFADPLVLGTYAHDGIILEVKKGDIAKNPATAWAVELRKNPDVTWKKIHEAHRKWNKTQRQLTPGAAAVIGLGISLATSGMGAGLLGLSGTLGQVASTAFTSIVSRASLSLINNQGDVGKVLKELSSSKSLRSFAVMLASAGIMKGIGLPTEAKGFEGHLKETFLGTTVSSSLSVIIEGKDPKEALGEALRTITAHTLGAMIAHKIGEAYSPLKGTDRIDPITHKIFHGLLGGGMGAILSKKPLEGILPGALGAVAAECLAELLSPDDLNSVVRRVGAKGKDLSDEELTKLYKQELRAYREEIKTSAKWAKFGAGVIALASGQDVDIAIETAKNAIDHNFTLPLLIGGVLAEVSVEGLIVLGGRLLLGARIFNAVENQRQLREQELKQKEADGKEEKEENLGNSGGDFDPENEGEKKQPHKNSLDYRGDTHVYNIKRADTGETYKIGESAQGLNKFGQSKRAQQQVRKLRQETGMDHKSEIIDTFPGKKEAREYETNLILEMRKRLGQDALPGNKGNH